MKINLWYSKSMKKWRWDLVDEKLDSASGQNTKLRDSLNEIEKMIEHYVDQDSEKMEIGGYDCIRHHDFGARGGGRRRGKPFLQTLCWIGRIELDARPQP